MAARPRKAGGIRIPNLYERLERRTGKTVYQYRNPKTGTFHSWTNVTREEAISAAVELNQVYAQADLDLVSKILNQNSSVIKERGITCIDFCEKYLSEINRRFSKGEITKSTFINKRYYINMFSDRFGHTRIKELSNRDIAQVLGEFLDKGKETSAKAIRDNWISLFKEAQYLGEVDLGFNPALATRSIKVQVKRARLTVGDFIKINEYASSYRPQYINYAIKLAITTGLRRADIANLMFKDVVDGHLQVELSKSRKKVVLAFPLEMKSPLLDQTLGDIISECRGRILSHYIVHHIDYSPKIKIGSQVNPDLLTNQFTRLVELTNIKVSANKTPPTFHELRALAAKSYRSKSEFDEVQSLLGHKTKEMTEKYLDERTDKTIYVKVTG